MSSPKTAAGRKPSNPSWRSCCAIALISMLWMLALSSCATGTGLARVPPAPPPPPPAVDPSLLQECEEGPLAQDSRLATLLANHDAREAVAKECRDRHHSLIAAARELQATMHQWYCEAIDALDMQADDCKAGARK